ncbi:MAG TPA: hypothetical protein VGL02_04365, partial [Streptomyces sp.]
MRFAKTAVIAVVVTALVALFTGGATASAAPAPAVPAPAAPITGTFTDASGGTGTAAGTFTPTGFVADGQNLVANGVANVTLTDAAGRQVGSQSRAVSVPVGVAAASCQILD